MIARRFPRFAAALLVAAAALLSLPAPVRAQDEAADTLTVIFTGDVKGMIKSCGCPDLDLGGMTHRVAFLDTLDAMGWTYLMVDAGGLTPPGELNPQTRLKTEYLCRIMARMGFDGVGLGVSDLAHGPGHVAALARWLEQPVLATNVSLPDSVPHVRTKIAEADGHPIGLVSLFDPMAQSDKHSWFTVTPWEELRPAIESLRAETHAIVAMAAVADSSRLADLAAAFPEISLLIGVRAGDMPAHPVLLDSQAYIGGGNEGKLLGQGLLYFDEGGYPFDVRAQLIGILETWGRTPWVDDMIVEYNRELRNMLIRQGTEGGP